MRTPLALLVAAALAIGTPAPAGAHGVPAQATTTTATAAVSGTTVTLTITVAADSEPLPEGTVTLTEGDTDLGTLPLDGGTATWSGTTTPGTHTYDAAYTPADGRWLASAAEPETATVAGACGRRCEPPYVGRVVAPKRVRAGTLAKIRVTVLGRTNRLPSGWARVRVSGPKGYTWVRRDDLVKGRATLRTRRLNRVGAYRVVTLVHVDGATELEASTSFRVVKR